MILFFIIIGVYAYNVKYFLLWGRSFFLEQYKLLSLFLLLPILCQFLNPKLFPFQLRDEDDWMTIRIF